MTILGLGGLHRDPAAAVLRDGRILSAIEQKKVVRRAAAGLPREAAAEALRIAGLSHAGVEVVAVARPFDDSSTTQLHLELRDLFPNARIVTVGHHLAHAASAFYASSFEQATVLTLDRAGDFRCGARWRAASGRIALEKEFTYPDSIGDLYSRVTELLGFVPSSDEHKVQWLSTAAPPDLAPLFRSILVHDRFGLRVDRSYFDAGRISSGGFSAKLYAALGLPDETPVPDPLKARIAAGLQRAVEDVVLDLAGEGENLCLAGGLTYNALLVHALEGSGRWQNVFVQPAAGNTGTALGAAWHAWYSASPDSPRVPFDSLALGPSYSPEEIKQVLENCKLRFRYLLTGDEVVASASALLRADKIVAWMQGRMEFGPRALGFRSILASPLDPYSTENLNVYIKHREPFRKFAASVPAELASTYFDVGPNARFLSTVGRVLPAHRQTFASATLGQDFIRVHTVDPRENPLFHRLLLAWGQLTGLPVLYNTSFNLFSDPLVCSPRDAVRGFFSSGIDAMLTGNFLLEK